MLLLKDNVIYYGNDTITDNIIFLLFILRLDEKKAPAHEARGLAGLGVEGCSIQNFPCFGVDVA